MLLKYANNASTTLQSGITATATSAVLSTGTGVEFPALTGDDGFYLTFEDAATQLINEIVLVTARTGDAITIERGQQGSTQRAWNAGDIAAQLLTASDTDGFAQSDQLQNATYTGAVATGSANSIAVSLLSSLTALPELMPFVVEASAANTGNVTLTMTFSESGMTFAAHPVLKFGGSQLNAADIPEAGFPMQLVWVGSLNAFIMCNPASGSAGSIAGGLANQLLKQTAPGTTGFVPAPSVVGSVLSWTGSAIAWLAAAVTSFNGRSGAVTPQIGDYTAGQVGAVPLSAFQAPNVQLSNPCFGIEPSGLIIQAGSRAVSPGALTTVSFPKTFPNLCVSVVSNCNSNANVSTVNSFNNGSFNNTANANFITWVAVGF